MRDDRVEPGVPGFPTQRCACKTRVGHQGRRVAGARVVMMTESGNHTASLKLSPEHLGPLEINITVRDEKGTVLGRSGDEPLAEDLFNVNQSRTASDPPRRRRRR